jgi:hypothetical protein
MVDGFIEHRRAALGVFLNRVVSAAAAHLVGTHRSAIAGWPPLTHAVLV